MRKILSIAGAFFFTAAVGAWGADVLIAVGVGRIGSWRTEVVLANGTGAETQVQIAGFPQYQIACPGPCPWEGADLYPNTSVAFTDDEMVKIGTGILTFYVSAADGSSLPVSRIRVVNTETPTQAIEIPTVRESAIRAGNFGRLSFPGAVRNSLGHSNLALANLMSPDGPGTGPDLQVQVEAFAEDGTSLGVGNYTIGFGQTIFLGDVLGQLGVASLDDGSISVTKIGGEGLLWGTASTVFANGGVAVSLGANP
jgi:hypothetical protein